MPIEKYELQHKFGIISHSQRLDLQERLLKQTYVQSLSSKCHFTATRNPVEINDIFIQQFNNAKTLDEREKCEQTAYKMLQRVKRRVGLCEAGQGPHVNLTVAWTELSQLAQCKGNIQEDCLDILIASLDQSPLNSQHVPVLFFLAETMLYWLRTEAVQQIYLRTGEVKLLKMGQLVFTRLFYHHMTGELHRQEDFKHRLYQYLNGLPMSQEAYSPYPIALLSLRFIIEVGKIILSDTSIDAGVTIEDHKIPSPLNSAEQRQISTERVNGTTSSHSAAISSSVHDLSPTLWHALDVWRCTNNLTGGLPDAVQALAHCGQGLANESWVDGVVALYILSEAAKANMTALRGLQNLAGGYDPRPVKPYASLSGRSSTSETFNLSEDELDTALTSATSHLTSKPTLSDICERSEDNEKSATGTLDRNSSAEIAKPIVKQQNLCSQRSPGPLSSEHPRCSLDDNPQSLECSGESETGISDDKSVQDVKLESRMHTSGSMQRIMISKSAKYGYEMRWNNPTAEDGSIGHTSAAGTTSTFTNLPAPGLLGISGWHWEVAVVYTEVLADICLNAKNSTIKKIALMGNNKDISSVRGGYTTVPLKSAGLLDLVFFYAVNEVRDGGPNDWSWRVRHGAIQSLVRVFRCMADDKNHEGLRTAAWNIMLRSHSLEQDGRVLEALKVGQVQTDMSGLIDRKLTVASLSIGRNLAAGLSAIYLPPLPPLVLPQRSMKPKELPTKPRPTPREATPTQAEKKRPLRTTLREEIMLSTALYVPPVDFNKRTSFDLRRIVEDQWRKELQEQVDIEEAERLKELEDKQSKQEEDQYQRAILKARKLKKQGVVSPSQESELPSGVSSGRNSASSL